MTFWHLIEEDARAATYSELGSVLRDLHALPVPAGLGLPLYDALGRPELRFDSARGLPHGDAHVQNLMVDRSGRVILIDFEVFCHDHSEWDLMVTATAHDSLGWQTSGQYAAFMAAYGWDMRDRARLAPGLSRLPDTRRPSRSRRRVHAR